MENKEFETQLRQAFGELQMKMMDSNQQIQNASKLQSTLKHELRVESLVKAQILDGGKEAPIFRRIGRAYQIDDYDEAIERLTKSIASNEERVNALEKKKEYLKKDIEESEKNVREILSSRG
uniref:Prefoldin subunit 1 n=1 Tax=Rhabditophanes sp. KR3021 TaxID=114890 RepID=A0AC35TIT1_9BILA